MSHRQYVTSKFLVVSSYIHYNVLLNTSGSFQQSSFSQQNCCGLVFLLNYKVSFVTQDSQNHNFVAQGLKYFKKLLKHTQQDLKKIYMYMMEYLCGFDGFHQIRWCINPCATLVQHCTRKSQAIIPVNGMIHGGLLDTERL